MCLSVLICKIELLTAPPSQGWREDETRNPCKTAPRTEQTHNPWSASQQHQEPSTAVTRSPARWAVGPRGAEDPQAGPPLLALVAPRRSAQSSFPNPSFNSALCRGQRHHISFIPRGQDSHDSELERKHWTLASLPSPGCLKITHTQMMFTAEQSRRH